MHASRTSFLERVLALVFVLVLLCILAGAGWFGFSMWQFNRPPFILSRLEQLRPAMTTNEVQKLLGTPASAWTRTNGSGQAYSEWAYRRPSSWPIVYVYFKPDGTFERHRYDY
jgi:hypothetical protein